jgi:hypothetical protein
VKDDATIEGAPITIWGDSALHIQNIGINNCCPPLELNFDFMSSSTGDVLVTTIQKRKGIPHAIVHRNGWEIRSRTYLL